MSKIQEIPLRTSKYILSSHQDEAESVYGLCNFKKYNKIEVTSKQEKINKIKPKKYTRKIAILQEQIYNNTERWNKNMRISYKNLLTRWIL